MARECIVAREFKSIAGCTMKYLELFVSADQARKVAVELEKWARQETLSRSGDGTEEVDDEHKHEVEIVNADFSLAYGGMMILTHTNLKLYQGHR
jgi:elongation factor 3